MQSTTNSERTETNAIPTSLFIPKSLHSRVKMVAAVKRVRMADIILEGIEMALQSRFLLSEEERRALLGA